MVGPVVALYSLPLQIVSEFKQSLAEEYERLLHLVMKFRDVFPHTDARVVVDLEDVIAVMLMIEDRLDMKAEDCLEAKLP